MSNKLIQTLLIILLVFLLLRACVRQTSQVTSVSDVSSDSVPNSLSVVEQYQLNYCESLPQVDRSRCVNDPASVVDDRWTWTEISGYAGFCCNERVR